jgi:enoyl-CoA hydratase/carnithine racemase
VGKANNSKVGVFGSILDALHCNLTIHLHLMYSSPDSVFVTKRGLLLALERDSLTKAANELMDTDEAYNWKNGENIGEGLRAFVEKRAPNWTNPKSFSKSKL